MTRGNKKLFPRAKIQTKPQKTKRERTVKNSFKNSPAKNWQGKCNEIVEEVIIMDARALGISESELAMRVAQGDTAFEELLCDVREEKKYAMGQLKSGGTMRANQGYTTFEEIPQDVTGQPESEGFVPVQITSKMPLVIQEHGKRGFKSKVVCPTPVICRAVLSVAERYMVVSRRSGSRIFYTQEDVAATCEILDTRKSDIGKALADL